MSTVSDNKIRDNLKRLKEMNEHFDNVYLAVEAFWNTVPSLLCIVKDGKFLKVSSHWTRVLGWDISELIGKNYIEFVHPDDIANTIDAASRLSGAPSQDFVHVNRYKTKSGGWVELKWKVSSVNGDTITAVACECEPDPKCKVCG